MSHNTNGRIVLWIFRLITRQWSIFCIFYHAILRATLRFHFEKFQSDLIYAVMQKCSIAVCTISKSKFAAEKKRNHRFSIHSFTSLCIEISSTIQHYSEHSRNFYGFHPETKNNVYHSTYENVCHNFLEGFLSSSLSSLYVYTLTMTAWHCVE